MSDDILYPSITDKFHNNLDDINHAFRLYPYMTVHQKAHILQLKQYYIKKFCTFEEQLALLRPIRASKLAFGVGEDW